MAVKRGVYIDDCVSAYPSVTPVVVPAASAEYVVSMTSYLSVRPPIASEPVLLREGGSIPIVNEFKRYLKADSLMVGLALPDDNAHSPNEKFDLDCFAKGQLMSAHLWQELARAAK